MSILAAASTVGNLSRQLGIDNQQLQSGKYNGCSFYTALPFSQITTDNAAAQLVAKGVYGVTRITGNLTDDPNGYGNLYNTNLALNQASATITKKLNIINTPLTDGTTIQDLGTSGWKFKFTAYFIGDDYDNSFANLSKAIINPPEKYKYILQHPIFGLIPGKTYLRRLTSVAGNGLMKYLVVYLDLVNDTTSAFQSNKNALLDAVSKSLNGVISAVDTLSTISAILK